MLNNHEEHVKRYGTKKRDMYWSGHPTYEYWTEEPPAWQDLPKNGWRVILYTEQLWNEMIDFWHQQKKLYEDKENLRKRIISYRNSLDRDVFYDAGEIHEMCRTDNKCCELPSNECRSTSSPR